MIVIPLIRLMQVQLMEFTISYKYIRLQCGKRCGRNTADLAIPVFCTNRTQQGTDTKKVIGPDKTMVRDCLSFYLEVAPNSSKLSARIRKAKLDR